MGDGFDSATVSHVRSLSTFSFDAGAGSDNVVMDFVEVNGRVHNQRW